MSDTILATARDTVVIIFMFGLRIGMPLILTLFVGWWLERKLKEWDARDIAALEAARAKEKARTQPRSNQLADVQSHAGTSSHIQPR